MTIIGEIFNTIDVSIFMYLGIALIIVLGVNILAKLLEPKFIAVPVLNKTEKRLFAAISSIIQPNLRLCPQVSYGEFLGCKSSRKFWKINAKRADMIVVNEDFHVVAVIEYQGSGHFGKTKTSRSNSLRRDRQKQKALKEAGIPLYEIPASFKKDQLEEMFIGMSAEPAS
jgi:hypothetical protein